MGNPSRVFEKAAHSTQVCTERGFPFPPRMFLPAKAKDRQEPLLWFGLESWALDPEACLELAPLPNP